MLAILSIDNARDSLRLERDVKLLWKAAHVDTVETHRLHEPDNVRAPFLVHEVATQHAKLAHKTPHTSSLHAKVRS